MNFITIIIISIISACIGMWIGAIIFHKPTEIKFKISPIDSLMYAFVMFLVITVVMVLELSINQWNLRYFKPADWWLKFFSRAIDGGLLVAIALPLLSMLLGKWMKVLNLDLCIEYNIIFLKIYYSIVIIANCIWLLISAGPEVVNDSLETQSILNRVIIWMLSVGGTWAGMGLHCEGRISEELKNIKKSKEKKNLKQTLKYSIPFVIAFLINCCLLFMQTLDVKWMKRVSFLIYCIAISGLVGMLLLIWIMNCIECPSEKRSDKKLVKAINQMNNENIVTERYQTIQYSLLNEENQKYIKIHEQKVIWAGHEEISSCFGEQKKSVEEFRYEECKEYLTKIREDRKECIRKGEILCKEEVKKQLLKQNQQ